MALKRLSAVLLGGAVTVAALLVSAQPDAQAIVGGSVVTESYPFMVSYPSGGCAGILIKSNWVATAKRCGQPETVRVGGIDRINGGMVVRVGRAVQHSQANLQLLPLATSVPYAPLPIATSPPLVGDVVRIIGWGQTCGPPGCGSYPAIARQLDSTVTFENRCVGIDGTNELCIANNGSTGGPCYGDFGDPAVRQSNNRWLAHGLIAVIPPTCGSAPSIAVDLAILRPWISTIVGGGLPSSA